MRIYSNSSYKYSPTGFAIGYVDQSEIENDGYSYLKPCDLDIIRKLFENGDIKGAYGKLPNSNKYVYLVKKLDCSFKNQDNVEAKKYCNFAFVFDSNSEYSDFKKNYDVQSLTKHMNDFIVPDGTVEKFGLSIQNSSLKMFLSGCLKGSVINYSDEEFYIEATSSSTDISKKLSDFFSVNISREKDSKYSTKKKHGNAVPIIVGIVTAIAMATIIIITVTVSNK